MRVLGIDPGSRNTGLGVVESTATGLHCAVYHCVRLGGGALPARLGMVYREVQSLIAQYRPDVVAVEQVFMSTSARSALILGQARGSAICAAVTADLPVAEYSALQVKQAVVGTGSAQKHQVQHMVRVLLGLRACPGVDAADALACAICHLHTRQSERKLAMAVQA